jgi:hypothetical protein
VMATTKAPMYCGERCEYERQTCWQQCQRHSRVCECGTQR